jgi:hypothetical protein
MPTFKQQCVERLCEYVAAIGPISQTHAARLCGVHALTALDWLRELAADGAVVEWKITGRYSLFGEVIL